NQHEVQRGVGVSKHSLERRQVDYVNDSAHRFDVAQEGLKQSTAAHVRVVGMLARPSEVIDALEANALLRVDNLHAHERSAATLPRADLDKVRALAWSLSNRVSVERHEGAPARYTSEEVLHHITI